MPKESNSTNLCLYRKGYRTIADTFLNMYGWIVSDVAIWKSMKRLGIKGYLRQQKSPDTEGSEHNRYANILNREVYPERPMQKIVTDLILEV